MKTWCLVDTLTVACLLIVIPCSTKCDSDGKSPEKSDPKTGSNVIVHAPNGTLSSGKTNTSMIHETGNFTASNTSKSAALNVSSREGVLTKVQSPQSLPKAESSSGKPPVQLPVPQEPPKVLSPAGVGAKKQNETGLSPDKKDVLNWIEGGGGLPAPKSKESESSEHLKSSSKVPDEGAKSTSMKPDKHISARKGAVLPPDLPSEPHPAHVEQADHVQPHSSHSTVPTAASSTAHPRKHKPHFTMVRGDKFTSSSESIIESATTGRDYIFPLVLLIFAVPGTVFLIKFLYKRGTEFTERQQYHRMYLIDGMYNAR